MNITERIEHTNMNDILKDVNSIWNRLFDHKAFLNGEVQFFVREFEKKRNDTEVEQLFSFLEKITDIRDTQLDRLKQAVDSVFPQTNIHLNQALTYCNRIADIEEKYQSDASLELAKENRKLEWQQFVCTISRAYKTVDRTFQQKEEEIEEFYSDLEKKQHIGSNLS